MVIEVNEKYFNLLYAKAKEKCFECINHEGNEHLEHEAGIQLNSILLRETTIKIIFRQENIHEYLLEINLFLYDCDNEIGKYSYTESMTGESIDDSLVFY